MILKKTLQNWWVMNLQSNKMLHFTCYQPSFCQGGCLCDCSFLVVEVDIKNQTFRPILYKRWLNLSWTCLVISIYTRFTYLINTYKNKTVVKAILWVLPTSTQNCVKTSPHRYIIMAEYYYVRSPSPTAWYLKRRKCH